jgi:hypothetical protein
MQISEERRLVKQVERGRGRGRKGEGKEKSGP